MLKMLLMLILGAVLELTLGKLLVAEEANGAREMYLQYCGSCHGRDAKGGGPVSRVLAIEVPDLTVIAKQNRGVYPLDDVIAKIDGRRVVRGHGDTEMPVWGENFHTENKGKRYPELTTLLKAKAIAEYIGTLQIK